MLYSACVVLHNAKLNKGIPDDLNKIIKLFLY